MAAVAEEGDTAVKEAYWAPLDVHPMLEPELSRMQRFAPRMRAGHVGGAVRGPVAKRTVRRLPKAPPGCRKVSCEQVSVVALRCMCVNALTCGQCRQVSRALSQWVLPPDQWVPAVPPS